MFCVVSLLRAVLLWKFNCLSRYDEIMTKQDPPSTSAYVRASSPLSICTVPKLFMAISLSSVAAERRALIARGDPHIYIRQAMFVHDVDHVA